MTTEPSSAPEPPRRVILVGCVSAKLPQRAPARDLYISELFRRRRAYAERSGAPWRILSAWYGLLLPEQEIDPYDISFTHVDRKPWRKVISSRVACALVREGFTLVEIHAGAEYTVDLLPLLRQAEIAVELPLTGLGIGEQLAWYKHQEERARTSSVDDAQLRLF